jgi:hypothetical protein
MGFGGFFCFKNSGLVFNERVGLYFYDKRVASPFPSNSQNLNILSSQDTNNTKSNTKHKNLNVSYTVYGTNSGGLSGSMEY